LYSFTNISVAGDPWKAPDKYLKMKNPEKADTASIAAGKVLYNKHCASCHGKKDLGDGIKAAQFDASPGNFTEKSFSIQRDASLFYKTLEGRDDMPSCKKKGDSG
jgi:mono/diheme cytochrome c family protein